MALMSSHARELEEADIAVSVRQQWERTTRRQHRSGFSTENPQLST